tara:strand:- start:2350 stop:3573 length:1224 start_codon:yes stop_codon:yes gene_type:complete
MTPQSFSYVTLGNNGMLYCAPFGLTDSIDFMIKMNPETYEITKIQLEVNDSREKWQTGIAYRNRIYFLPYNENKILVVDTNTDTVEYIELKYPGQGKYIQGHIHGNQLVALPYGEHTEFDWVIHLDLDSHILKYVHLELAKNDCKKWHTTQIIDGIIYGAPRGENWEEYFPYIIEYDCNAMRYNLIDMSNHWQDYDQELLSNKKFTTLARVGRKMYSPPYCENPNFDILLTYNGNDWRSEKTGIKSTSRKYYAHTVASNGKVFFPPAGHDEDWSEMLIINSKTDKWYTKDLGIGKESKKYFAGVENSQGKIYYIPRGGCVCEPEDTWKSQGDLAEVLVVDTATDDFYTIDISEYFKDSTTIEKYNQCIIKNDIIYAFPYGESETFQTVLIFDTLSEKVIHTVDLNDI